MSELEDAGYVWVRFNRRHDYRPRRCLMLSADAGDIRAVHHLWAAKAIADGAAERVADKTGAPYVEHSAPTYEPSGAMASANWLDRLRA